MPFAISNALKDFDYYLTMSTEAGARHQIADGVRAALAEAVAAGKGASFLPELTAILRKAQV